ncbi:MAG TPA: ribosome maturation factor RimM [Candidatus Angelobacter sp.]|nr:ribosome maturation factor RimM [Candidatus Angelobacter sp.]
MDEEQFITIAKVSKTQGRIGEVAAMLLTDFPERFTSRTQLFALMGNSGEKGRRRELQLEDHWFHKGMVVLKFAGVDSISQAEELLGCEIQIPKGERTSLEQDAVYVSDLVGCSVYDSGKPIGDIQDVQFGSGEAPLLVIRGVKEYLVPFAAGYIEEVSLERKQVKLKLPEGMLELDAPLTQEEKRRQDKAG